MENRADNLPSLVHQASKPGPRSSQSCLAGCHGNFLISWEYKMYCWLATQTDTACLGLPAWLVSDGWPAGCMYWHGSRGKIFCFKNYFPSSPRFEFFPHEGGGENYREETWISEMLMKMFNSLSKPSKTSETMNPLRRSGANLNLKSRKSLSLLGKKSWLAVWGKSKFPEPVNSGKETLRDIFESRITSQQLTK